MTSSSDEQLKIRLLAAAKTEFLSNGYAGANVGRIASAAGISKKTVYKYVASKQALLFEVMADVLSGPAQRMAQASPEQSLASRLELYLEGFSTLAFSEQGLASYRLLMSEGARFPELAEAYVNSLDQYALQPVARELEQAARMGHIVQQDYRLATRMLFSMVAAETLRDAAIGLGVVPDEAQRKALVGQALSIFLHGISGPARG
ncbi:TetR/AcrR family transcriptional regulator [Teredinibacter turnerae]|uniref:TetR/AcrR family transcriptional regulator n=1 Tax=Teredinibacter turnerae TaxID=2426 RepID=UPI000377EDCC|nr:TetR/AcrR family transcriptional regulator [Teredinibacter turnerae]